MPAELLYSGYYRGPITFLDSYTFLKLYPDGRWVFAEGLDPEYDFPVRIEALDIDKLSREKVVWRLADGETRLSLGRYRRGRNIPTLNCNNQVVGQFADALEETCGTDTWGRFQVEVVGPGQLRPTTHDVILTFVAETRHGSAAASDRLR
jgi:hypothetical protein